MNPRAILLAGLAWAGAAGAGQSAVIYVRGSAAGANDGSSWTNAYTSLQFAIAAATPVDEIWVAAGTYLPTATADRTASFTLKNGVGIYGGFNGTESTRTQRDPASNVTTLSGDIGTAGVATDNSHHVVAADGTVTASGVLDGFTVTGGRADGPATADQRGGGIYDSGGSPTLANLVLTSNFASDRGGGMRVESGSPTLTACVFQSNSAGSFGGGALSAAAVGALGVDGCVFKANSVANSTGGGAIHATNGVIVTNSLIVQNSPNAVILVGGGNAFRDCTITQNSGYAISLIGGASASTIVNSILYGDSIAEVYPLGNAPSISYTDLQGGGFGPGPGNVDADPLFLNAGAGDYRLGFGSPAVDAGNNAAVPGGVTTDLAGLSRFVDDAAKPDTGAGTPPIVDMGALRAPPLPDADAHTDSNGDFDADAHADRNGDTDRHIDFDADFHADRRADSAAGVSHRDALPRDRHPRR